MKLLKKINNYFLSDEETGEVAPLSDHLFYYGMLGFLVTLIAIFTHGLITF